MGVVVTVHRSLSLVRSTFSGRLGVAEFLESREKTARSDWKPSYRHLVDLRDVTEVALEPPDLERLAALPLLFDAGVLQVVVALDGTVIYGVVRQFQAAARGTSRNVHLVTTMEKAYALFGFSEVVVDTV